MTKYYLAGPMSGKPDHNWPAFTWWVEHLRRQQLEIVSPHELNDGMQNEPHTPENRLKCMRADLHALIDCDAIMLMPGWEKSRGACDEFEVARRLGLKIFFLAERLP